MTRWAAMLPHRPRHHPHARAGSPAWTDFVRKRAMRPLRTSRRRPAPSSGGARVALARRALPRVPARCPGHAALPWRLPGSAAGVTPARRRPRTSRRRPAPTSRTRPAFSSRSVCPSTSDSVRYACVTAMLPQSAWAISYALRGRSAISPWIFSARRSCSLKRSSISVAVVGDRVAVAREHEVEVHRARLAQRLEVHHERLRPLRRVALVAGPARDQRVRRDVLDQVVGGDQLLALGVVEDGVRRAVARGGSAPRACGRASRSRRPRAARA